MNQQTVPRHMLDDLSKFIASFNDSHPLLIAQKFCLTYNEYGKQFGLPAITEMIESIKNDRL